MSFINYEGKLWMWAQYGFGKLSSCTNCVCFLSCKKWVQREKYLINTLDKSHGEFTIGRKLQNWSSNPIAWDHFFGTQGVHTKIKVQGMRNEMVLMWHHFLANLNNFHLKITLTLRNQPSSSPRRWTRILLLCETNQVQTPGGGLFNGNLHDMCGPH